MIKKCKFCKKDIEVSSFQKMGGHVSGCDKNPNKLKTIEKIKKEFYEKNPIKRIELKCERCENKYSLEISAKNLEKGKYRRFCSRSCANQRTQKDETKNKISDSIKHFYKDKKRSDKFCLNCGVLLKRNNISGYCKKTEQCRKEIYSSVSEKMKGISKNIGNENPMFGVSPLPSKRIYFFSEKNNKEFIFKSSWELKAAKKLEDSADVIFYEYESIRIKYTDLKGKVRNYIPDFIVNGLLIIEVKPQKMEKFWDNPEKIKAGKKYCEINGMEYQVWNKEDLN